MIDELQPLNISLLVLTSSFLKYSKPVTSLAIFDNNTKNFNKDGLFSTDIFGEVTTEERNTRFSYIPLRVDILHPEIYNAVVGLKSLYGGIMSGTKFAIYNPKLNDFEPSSIDEGSTGYAFFMKYYKRLVFIRNKSTERDFKIDLILKQKDNSTIKDLVVLPAGLRDYTVDSAGKPSEGEINALYRKLLNVTNFLTDNINESDLTTVDRVRYKIQDTVNEIYLFIKTLLDGKNKFVQGKWSKRAIFSGTRNVITAFPNKIKSKDDKQRVGFNDTVIGLYQYSASIRDLVVFELKKNILNNVFVNINTNAKLINKKTLELENVEVTPKYRDMWASDEGLGNVIASLAREDLRNTYVEIDDFYLYLIYLGDDMTYKLFNNMSTVPSEIDKTKIRPITLAEVIYYSIVEISRKYPSFFTRYPAANMGSIYPTNCYLKTTITGEVRYKLDDSWKKTSIIANECPVITDSYFNSMSPNKTKLARLAADFDGDVCSSTTLTTDESIKEINSLMASPEFYLSPKGDIAYSASTNIINYVLDYTTGTPPE